jgi:hypothetical protein
MAAIRTIEANLWNSAKLLTDTISDNLGAEKGLWRAVAGLTQGAAFGVGAYEIGHKAVDAFGDTVKSITSGHPGDAVMYGLYDACLGVGAGTMAVLSVAGLRSGFKNDNSDELVKKAG